jgi:hypothetical protein
MQVFPYNASDRLTVIQLTHRHGFAIARKRHCAAERPERFALDQRWRKRPVVNSARRQPCPAPVSTVYQRRRRGTDQWHRPGTAASGFDLPRSQYRPATTATGALLPYRGRAGRQQRIGYDAFAEPTMNGRYLRSPDGWSRRIADVADRDPGRLNWAESGPTRIASGRIGVRAKAVIPLRARSTLHALSGPTPNDPSAPAPRRSPASPALAKSL